MAHPEFLHSTAPPPPSRPLSDAALLRRAIVELTAEAEQAAVEERLPRQETTFAQEFLQENQRKQLDGKLIFKRITEAVHKDAFVDAYARWQLLGFEPRWPTDEREYDDEDFEKMLADMPALLLNPRSDPESIARINLALARETVSESDAEALRTLDRTLGERAALIQNLNRPALELRRWFEENSGAEGHRHHQARLERLGALVESGWPTEDLKRQIAQRFEEAADDRSFSSEERARVARQAVALIGMRTPIIQSVGIGENNAPQAQFDETAVYDFEVNEWIRTLQGK